MSRTHVRRRTSVAAVAILVCAVLAGPVAGAVAGPRSSPPARSHVVQAGDTLWAIAAVSQPGADPRPLIEQIRKLNGVEAGSLRPGQTLLIPSAG